jgi:hypothetical protein
MEGGGVSVDYGAKGCRCWRSEDYNPWDDRTHGEWLPNASCPHHGLLADYTGGRTDTGAYRVILDPPLPDDKAEDARTGDAYTHTPGCQPQDCCGDTSAHASVSGTDTTLTPPTTLAPGAVACTRCDWGVEGWDELELYEHLFRHALTHTTTEYEEKKWNRSVNRRGWRSLASRIRGLIRSRN